MCGSRAWELGASAPASRVPALDVTFSCLQRLSEAAIVIFGKELPRHLEKD
jgi:hypothetical protein